MLGNKATFGAIWLTAQTVTGRLVGIVANLVLAWYLTREDFGLFGTAATIAAFCEVFGAGGIGTILIVRQKNFDLWAGPAQWLSAAFGIGVSVLMVASSVIAGAVTAIERDGELVGLVCVMALVPFFRSLATVPYSKLRIEMRFKRIAVIETSVLLVSGLAKIVLAIAGFGAFSFVLPTAAFALIRTVVVWLAAGTKVDFAWRVRRWKYLMNDGLMLMLTALTFKLVTYGDYAVLAFHVSTKELGTYFFAFTYSILGVVMLTSGLNGVLVPTFANLNDKPRQFLAFTRSAKLLLAIVCPLCFLQSAISEPAARILLKPNWEPAIILLQVLSLGMAGRTVSWLAASLMESQGRFRTRMLIGLVSAAVFMATVFIGVRVGGLLGTAIGVAIFYPIMSVFTTWVAISEIENPVQTLREILFKPVVSAAFAVLLPWTAAKFFDVGVWGQFILVPLAALLLYGLLLRYWMRETYIELASKLSVVLKSLNFKKENASSNSQVEASQ